MSSRLFIARIIPLLLLLLGGFGLAVADTGGTPKKNGVAFVAPVVSALVVSNGGNVTPGLVCAGQTITITPTITGATNIVSYSITPSFGFSVAQTSIAPGFATDYLVPPAPGGGFLVVRAIATNGLGESSVPFSVTYNVSQAPTGGVIAIPAAVCVNNPVTLSLTQAGNLTVLTAGSSPFVGGPSGGPAPPAVTITPTTSGANSFSIRGSDANGCFFNNTVGVTVNPAPTATIVATPNPVCIGSPVSFSLSGIGSVSLVTVSGATLGANVSPFISMTTASTTGTNTVSYTLASASGCTAVITGSYVVSALPANGPAVSLVAGTTLLGTGNATAASAPVNGVVTNANATVGSPSYTVCQNSSLMLSLSACPAVSTTTTSGTGTGQTVTFVGPGYVIITTANGSQVTVANGITSYMVPTSVTGTGGYQVACVNELGCSSTAVASFTLTVNETPVAPMVSGGVSGGQSVSICQGQSLTGLIACPANSLIIGYPNLGALGIATYSPTSGSASSFTFAAVGGSPGTGSFSVVCQSTLGCTSPATNFTLVVNPLPTTGPFVSVSLTAAGGVQSVTTINATAASSGSSITVCQNTSLLLSVTGCTSSDPASLSTNPIVVLIPGGAIGAGASVTAAGGPGTGLFLVSTSAISTSATGPYVYTIVCVNSFGCSSSSVASLSVTVNPSPDLASITAVNGTPANLAVAGGGTGSVAICQSSSPLIVNSNCLVTPGGNLTAGATVTSSNSMAGVGIGASSTATSGTFVSFSVSAATAGTFSYSFACQNSSGCLSPQFTVLSVVVNASAVAPTSAASQTICVDSGNVSFATGCGTNSATIVSAPTALPSSAAIVSNSLVIGTAASGTFVYGVQCRTSAGCSSSTTSYTLIVNPRPNLASLTAVNGTPANLVVAGGTSGAVAICQGVGSLTVLTNCFIASASSSNSANVATGNNSGVTGVDGSTAAAAGGSAGGATSTTFASFAISTTATGTTNFTFACVNQFGCASPTATTLSVTVNASVVAPTFAGSQTACLNSGLLAVAAACSTPTGVSLVITGPTGIASIADVNSTTATGTRSYTLQCVTPTCVSSTTTVTVIVRPIPANAALTPSTGAPIAGGALGSVAICQGSPLSVTVTGCPVTTGTVGGSSGTANSSNSNFNVNPVAGSSVTASVNSFTVNTNTVGTFSFTVNCTNEFLCTSPQATTISVTVNSSVAAPTFSGAQTACQNSNALAVAASCSTPTGVSLVITGANGIASIADVNSTSATGTRSYTLQCVTPTCVSSTTSLTVTVRELPNVPTLTPSAGGPMVAAGTSGTLVVCQGATGTLPLSVTTSCVLATAATSASGTNGLGGLNPGGSGGATGTDGTTASAGGAVGTGGTSTTFASFSLGTANSGVTTYTFVCVNQFGCVSPQSTTLTVVVNSSVAAPTFTGTQTACQNSNLLTVAPTCSTPTGVSLVIRGANGVASIADINSTSATGTRSYTLQCVTPTCVSSTTSLTVTVFGLPAAPSLTAVTAGGTVLTTVPPVGSGSIAVCQNSSLTVITSCFISTSSTSGTGNVATGVSSSAVGSDGNVASTAIGVTNGSSTTQTAAYVISTTALGTTTFTIRCQDQITGCLSASGTVLAVTVSASAATPTLAGTFTACLNSGLVSSTNTATSLNSALINGACPTGQTVEVRSASGVVDIATVLSTSAATASTGVSYTLTCILGQCRSTTTTTITKIVRELPDNAGLTVINAASQTLATVPAAGSGSVAVCQGQSLTVVTSCVINTSTASGSANVATGVNSGSVGQDGSVVAIAGGTTDGTSSTTFASFIISTSAVNTTTFTFRCQNEFGCTSPDATTLALVVSASVASPTLAGTFITAGVPTTVCQFATLSVPASCATANSTANFSGAQSFTGTPLAVNTSLPGTFVYSVVCRTASCVSTAQTFTVIVNAQPMNAALAVTPVGGTTTPIVGGQSGSITICEGTVINGLITGCPTTSGVVAGSGAPITGSGQIAVGGSTPGSSTASVNSFSIAGTLTAGTYNYTVVCVSVAGSATCVSPMATTLVVTVNGAPVSPTATYASTGLGATTGTITPLTNNPTSITVCQNMVTSLTVVGCNAANPGSTNNVGSQTSGSAVVLGGSQIIGSTANNSFFTIPNATTGSFQYTVVCTNPVTGCSSLTPLILNITVNPTPTSATIAGGVSLTVATPVCQLTPLTATISCPTGSTVALSPAAQSISGSTYTISTTATGTVTYSVTCISTSGGCPSPVRTFIVVVNPIPANAGLTVSPATLGGVAGTSLVAAAGGAAMTICQNSPISVTVTGCPTSDTASSSTALGTNTSAGANFGGVQITPGATGVNVFTIPTTTTGTFVYTANCTNSFGCSSSAVTSLTVTVNPTPLASGAIASQTVCLNQVATAVASCPTGSSAVFSGAQSFTGTTLTLMTSASTATTNNYTVVCLNSFGCVSPAQTFTVKVNPRPNLASLTAVNGTPANLAVAGGGTGSITACSGAPIRISTDCLISTVSNSGVGNSLTAVNTGNSGNGGVVDSGTSGTSVGGGQVGSGSTPTFASFLLSTQIATITTYTFVCVNQFGCASPTATTLSVTVNPTPAAPTVASSYTVCQNTVANPLSITACAVGQTAPTNSSGLGNRVTTAGNVVSVRLNGVLDNVPLVGSFTVVCTNSSGCTSSAAVGVTINPFAPDPTSVSISAGNPAVVATAGTALTICQTGQPVTLTVVGCDLPSAGVGFPISGSGTSFTFAGSGFVFSPTGPSTATALVTNGSFMPAGTYAFNVFCTTPSGCVSQNPTSMSITVVPNASPVVATGFAPTCPPISVTGTLSCATGNLSGAFSRVGFAGSTPFTAGNIQLPTQAGVYSITAVCSTGGACVGTPFSITVNNRLRSPEPISVQNVQNAVCLGQSTTLIAGCTPGSTANWYLAGTNTLVSGTAIGATSLMVAPLQQGTYNYEATCVTPGFACESVRSTQIVLTVLPGVNSLPTISAQPNPTVAGAPVTLTGAGCAGTTVFYVQGSNVELGRGTGSVVSITVTPQATTIYDAVCTNGQCTSNRTTGLVVTVTPCNFVATVTPSSAVICATGGSVILTASGGTSYVWNNGANTQQITVSAAGVYNVVVTSAQGCTAMGSATITTGTAPSPTITGNTTIFAGQSTTLTAGGGGLYAWNGPGLAPNAGGASQVVSQPGGYTVTVTSPTGCTASANVMVTVSALPGAPTVTPTATVAPNAPLQACVGQTIQLVASCPTGSMPRFKIGAMTNDAATQNVSSASPGLVTYQVVCVAGGNEGPATAASINFNAVPTVQILQTGVLCSNRPTSITLSATGAASYTWSTGQVAQSIVVNAVGLYSVNGANAAGCIGTATQTVSATTCGAATVLAISGATIDCVNGNVTIAATGGNGNQIQFSIGGVQYQPSNPVALNPAFQNNPANMFIQLFVRQVNTASTGFDVAGPFQFNFRAICPAVTVVTPPTPGTTLCGSPANTTGIGQALTVTGVTDINCNNGSFRVLTTGGTGAAIDYSVIVGLSNVDRFNCIRRVDNNEQLMAINNVNSSIGAFRLDVLQGSTMSAPFFFDFKAFCTNTPSTGQPSGTGGTGSTPPVTATTTPAATTTASPVAAGCGSPANTVGQPLTITGVDQVNCAAGTFRILTTGGSGQAINYASIVGLSNNNPYNCTRTLDNPDLTAQVNNPSSTIAPFNLKVLNVGGSASNTFVFNMKQVCTGTARVARTEGTGTLDVTVLGNPTLGESVEVEVRGAEGQALQLRLVDGLGTPISEKSVEKAGAVERQTIGLGRSAGMYFLQVVTPDKTKTVKVVRQ